MSLDKVVINSTVKQTATVIFLHGLGDTGHGWSQTIGDLVPPYAKVICPTAPVKPVTLNCGFPMPSWFDIKSLDMNSPEDEEGVNESSKKIIGIIEDEIKNGILSNRIVLGGFSQGGCVSLHTALQNEIKLAGVIALSCWLMLRDKYPNSLKQTNKSTPILQCHGESDPLVVLPAGTLTSQVLKAMVENVEFKTYKNLQHSACNEELEDIRRFLEKVIPPV